MKHHICFAWLRCESPRRSLACLALGSLDAANRMPSQCATPAIFCAGCSRPLNPPQYTSDFCPDCHKKAQS